MRTKILLFITVIFLAMMPGLSYAQMVRTFPEQPDITDTLLIIFDANQGNQALKNHEGAVYFHAGLITDRS
ncbi:MAG: hypothetical protein PHP48_07110, partial [Bacteroidales bacterium]|nr:hypothetical protein [Bacteroidales bacterium]